MSPRVPIQAVSVNARLASRNLLGARWCCRSCAKLLARAGDKAKIGFKVHPHMLRHACGYALANKGTLQAYLGHRSINSTTRYAALAPGRFQEHLGRA